MRLLLPLLTGLQVVLLMAWSVFWISLSGRMTLLTRNGDVALMRARRCQAPLHWRITGSRRVE